MKNTLSDLNNHLFAALETLNDLKTTDPNFELEIERSKAISTVANAIINNGKLAITVLKTSEISKTINIPLFKSITDGSM